MAYLRYALVCACFLGLPDDVISQPAESPPPVARTDSGGLLSSVTAVDAFAAWKAAFRVKALGEGIRPEVFDRAFAGVSINSQIVKLDRNQAEFVKPIWEYLDSAVSDLRITNGLAGLETHRDTLEAIEARYGVPREIVTAIWGMETGFGAVRGRTPVIEALATLAHDGRRARFFEAQLIAALQIMQAEGVGPDVMRGSWAGAMGHTQFMPTSYLAHAVDFDGDGKRNIWGDDPTDALASTASFLAEKGWRKGQPWAVEVTLPDGFDYSETGAGTKKPTAGWAALGVVAADGVWPEVEEASILLPAGHNGVALMILPNFHVIERYNPADAYVIAVGHLADRLAGGEAFVGGWPEGDQPLTRSERREVQELLLARGYDPQGVDGIIGRNTIAAVRAFQRAEGLVPDGYASATLLKALR